MIKSSDLLIFLEKTNPSGRSRFAFSSTHLIISTYHDIASSTILLSTVFKRRRETFSSQKSENRSWWRRENVWTSERKHCTHSHWYLARSIVSRRRFKKINVVDQNTLKHLQFNERYLQKISENSRIDRIDVEQRKDLSFHSSVRVFVVSSIFEETIFCAFTRRDVRHFKRKWRRSKFVREFIVKQHKTQNQFAMINHQHFIDKLTIFLLSCTRHWNIRNDCTRNDSRRKRI
jgi:hypothetical protein